MPPACRRSGSSARVSACGSAGVGRPDRGERLGLQVGQGRHRERAERAGVVHQQVEGPVAADRRDQVVAMGRVVDVTGDRGDVVETRDGLREPCRVAAVGDDAPSAVGERVDEGSAQPGGTAGDERERTGVSGHASKSATSSSLEIKGCSLVVRTRGCMGSWNRWSSWSPRCPETWWSPIPTRWRSTGTTGRATSRPASRWPWSERWTPARCRPPCAGPPSTGSASSREAPAAGSRAGPTPSTARSCSASSGWARSRSTPPARSRSSSRAPSTPRSRRPPPSTACGTRPTRRRSRSARSAATWPPTPAACAA